MHSEAFLFGLTIAIAIGPIALLILNASLDRGVLARLACGVGAACADFTFGVVAFSAGTALLTFIDDNRDYVSYVSASTLCGLGIWLLLQAWTSRTNSMERKRQSIGFTATYLLTMTNPLTVLVFAAWLGSHHVVLEWSAILTVSLAVFAGSLLVQASLAFFGGVLRTRIRREGLLVANMASGAGILAFGAYRFLQL
ncbi:MAG: LysE family transporter [Proteobacteria bacterium]|nr:LysE family transporter [Pseudomonadota bacterium]